MKPIMIYDPQDFDHKPLNISQLLPYLRNGYNWRAHPDSSRQRKARQRARELRAARELKRVHVPLCRVPEVYEPLCSAEPTMWRIWELRRAS